MGKVLTDISKVRTGKLSVVTARREISMLGMKSDCQAGNALMEWSQ